MGARKIMNYAAMVEDALCGPAGEEAAAAAFGDASFLSPAQIEGLGRYVLRSARTS